MQNFRSLPKGDKVDVRARVAVAGVAQLTTNGWRLQAFHGIATDLRPEPEPKPRKGSARKKTKQTNPGAALKKATRALRNASTATSHNDIPAIALRTGWSVQPWTHLRELVLRMGT